VQREEGRDRAARQHPEQDAAQQACLLIGDDRDADGVVDGVVLVLQLEDWL
jgi:hypothetical protein